MYQCEVSQNDVTRAPPINASIIHPQRLAHLFKVLDKVMKKPDNTSSSPSSQESDDDSDIGSDDNYYLEDERSLHPRNNENVDSCPELNPQVDDQIKEDPEIMQPQIDSSSDPSEDILLEPHSHPDIVTQPEYETQQFDIDLHNRHDQTESDNRLIIHLPKNEKEPTPELLQETQIKTEKEMHFANDFRSQSILQHVIDVKSDIKRLSPVRVLNDLVLFSDKCEPVLTGTREFISELEQRTFKSARDVIMYMNAEDVTEDFFNEHGFTLPIMIINTNNLGLKVPYTTKYSDIFNLLRQDIAEVEVIDVYEQNQLRMPLAEFAAHITTEPRLRTKLYNMISLEVSKTRLGELIEPPTVLQNIDFQHRFWGEPKPGYVPLEPSKVEKYCLISPVNSFTDFHIDFSGTSVWYHIKKGVKVFYLIKPTPNNIRLFWTWFESNNRLKTFFADQVDHCYKCTLTAGSTLFLPTGWIHAVLTEEDSLVFGGNFLHIYNMPMHLDIFDVEEKLKVEAKYVYPFFKDLHWFSAYGLKEELAFFNSRSSETTPKYLIEGVKRLLVSLKQWLPSCSEVQNRYFNGPQLIKDLTKEIRVAERRLLSLSPPKPVRESTRVKKKPALDDFVEYSEISKKRPKKVMPSVMSFPGESSSSAAVYMPEVHSSPEPPTQSNQWHVKTGGLKVILSKSSSDKTSDKSTYTIKAATPPTPFNQDFFAFNEHEFDDRPLEPYQRSYLQKRSLSYSAEAAQQLEKPSETNKRIEPSPYRIKLKKFKTGADGTSSEMWTTSIPFADEEVNRSIHQDDDFIYPSLDNSDDEDTTGMKSKPDDDKSWNPRSKVNFFASKSNRPTRVGKTKIAVEKGLEAAAAKTPSPAPLKQILHIKKLNVKAQTRPSVETPTSSTTPLKDKTPRPKKGLNTTKQRLGKILKLHKLRR